MKAYVAYRRRHVRAAQVQMQVAHAPVSPEMQNTNGAGSDAPETVAT